MMSLFRIDSLSAASPLIFAGVLLVILVISFRSRAVVFCQYLRTMTGIELKPKDVRRVFRQRGKDGVREFFLELIIHEDLKQGPIDIPAETADESDPFLVNS
jgi:hypothetical protein